MYRTDATLEQNTRWHDERLSKHGAYARDLLIAHARMVIEQAWQSDGGNHALRYRAVWQTSQPPLPQERVTLRVEIQRDAYLEQSYVKVERFDGAQWQQIHSVPVALLDEIRELRAPSYGRGSHVNETELKLMRAGAAEALLQACQVLSLLEIVNCAVYFDASKGLVVGLLEPLPDDDDE